jgi:hypothetical protein
MHRKCPGCGGRLEVVDSDEEEAGERAGNARSKTRYACAGCGQRFHHTYWERFSGDTQAWWRIDGDTFTELAESEYPEWDR